MCKENKSDGVQTSDAFWRSAHVATSKLSFKWYRLMFFIISITSDFSEIKLVCDGQTDGWTHLLIEIQRRI